MRTVDEITNALPSLTVDELQRVERVLIGLYRQRKSGIVFDDSYGTLTEEDLRAVQEDALRIIDGEPGKQ